MVKFTPNEESRRRVAHSFRVLVAVFRRDELSLTHGFPGLRRAGKSSRRWNTVASTRHACATQT